ncbi:MAG: M48 family metalloprotease [Gemmatimonadota bacterium]
MSRSLKTALVGVAGAVALACAVNPATGRKELSLVSESQEVAMGQEGAKETRATIGLYPDSGVQQLVARVGQRLAGETERPSLPWSFQVVDDPAVNAFAFPGGPIFVTRGLLAYLNSEAELAAVVGHEIGHVTARHTAAAISRAQVAQLGLGLGMVLSSDVRRFGGVASQGLGLLLLKYGRDAESQADELGFRYALANGYDVREAAKTFQTFARLGEGSGQRLPQWLSTHPDPGNRAERARERAAALPPEKLQGLAVDRDAYLRTIDGLIFGANPRQGYFQGATFLHPDLAFRLEFPPGWTASNMASSVTALNPEKNAQLELTLAGQTAPAQALGAFLAQRGVQRAPGTDGTGSINGLPAAYSAFTAVTESGTLQGYVAFIGYDGHTYRLLGLTTQSLQAMGPVFERSIRTFGRLTDRTALNIQPARIQIVKLPRAMSFRQFLQQYPSTVPDQQVALINFVEPDDGLPAGRLMKRVR